MWIVLTSVSSSALLPQSFTSGPSPLGCPPYCVNYDPHHHQSSDQIPLLTLGILAQLIPQTRKGAHASAVHACLSLFMCENWETSLFPSPKVGGSDGWYHASSAGSWMGKQQPQTPPLPVQILVLGFLIDLLRTTQAHTDDDMTITSVCYVLHWCKYRNVWRRLEWEGCGMRSCEAPSWTPICLCFYGVFYSVWRRDSLCRCSGFQTWWSTEVQKPTGLFKRLSFNPPLNLTTVPFRCSYLPDYFFEFIMRGQFCPVLSSSPSFPLGSGNLLPTTCAHNMGCLCHFQAKLMLMNGKCTFLWVTA